MNSKNLLLAFWLVTPFAGCASLNDAHYEHTQKARARAAWRCVPDRAKQHCYPKDYEQGWKDGFYDVATGGKGCPPVVAPQKYWRPEQVLESCDNERHAYYDGFQDGAACALRYPDTHYLKLWTSCECPLPRCEYQCAPGVNCPTGACGFTAFPDAILEGEFTPIAGPIPTATAIDATALASPEVVPLAPAVKYDAAKDAHKSEGSEKPKTYGKSNDAEDSVKHAPVNRIEFGFVDQSLDDLNLQQVTSAIGRTNSVATVSGPISDPVWLELESDLQFVAERQTVPSASDAKDLASPAVTKPSAKTVPKPSSEATKTKVIKPIIRLAEPITPTALSKEASKSKPLGKTAHSTTSKAAVSSPGMIEQSTVEMAKPIVAPNWGLTTKPIVEVASEIELKSQM